MPFNSNPYRLRKVMKAGTFKRIKNQIEETKKRIRWFAKYQFPGLSFNHDGVIARDEKINELYDQLDNSITEIQMDNIFIEHRWKAKKIKK